MPNPLSWLGAVMPEPSSAQVSAEQRRKYEAEQQLKKRQFRQEHPIRGAIGDAMDTAFDYLGGLTGMSDNPESTANMLGQLTDAAADLIPGKAAISQGLSLAGMPFAWYKAQGKVPKHGLLHGTPAVIDRIDPAYTNAGAHNMDFYGTPSPKMANEFWERGQKSVDYPTGSVLPFEPEAKNVLDLIDVDPADMHKIMRNLEPDIQARYMDYFNDMISKGYSNREAYINIANVMGLPKGVAEKSGFDAVRYPYGDKLNESGKVVKDEAWGVSNKVPIYSTYGRTPLNSAAQERLEQTARDKRREVVSTPTSKSPQISVAPEGFKPPEGAVLPSGRKMPVKKEKETVVAVAEPETSKPEFNKKRMSLAELMASGTQKPEMRTVKLPNGKVVQITKEEFDKIRGGRR